MKHSVPPIAATRFNGGVKRRNITVPTSDFRYFIDEILRYHADINDVDKSSRTLQTLQISGWAFGAQPILGISALVDGTPCPVRASTGLIRDDVMKAYPGEVNAQQSGFRVALGLSDTAGHQVRLQFRASNCDQDVAFEISPEGTSLLLMLASDITPYSGYSQEDLKIFDEFDNASPRPTAGFVTDFIGSRARISSLWDGTQHLDGVVLPKPIPRDYHSETVEWLGLLKAVLASKDQFTAMELGAGFGPWLAAGTVAARLRGILDIRLLGVEADQGRFRLLEQNLRDNGIDPDQHTLICGAVGVASGKAKWPRLGNPRNDCGGRPVRILEDDGLVLDNRDVRYLENIGDGLVDIEIVAFEYLLTNQPLWDLVHMDVQGTEVELCTSCLTALSERVRYLVVGTHSRKIEGDLLLLLYQAGWILEHENPSRFVYNADQLSLERMTTHDGTQIWRNPDL
jgi:hypothetical protein